MENLKKAIIDSGISKKVVDAAERILKMNKCYKSSCKACQMDFIK